MNKTILYGLLVGCAALLLTTSCSFNRGAEIHTTPDIRYYSPITRHAADTLLIDTLLVKIVEDGYLLDTLQVGDTAYFDLVFNTGYNNMQRVQITHDATCSKLHYFYRSQLDSIVLPSSNIDNGELLFEQGVMVFRMQLGYIATAPALNPKLVFTLESDSKYSPGRRTITTPIIPKRTE